jgi:hypothetical protein|tara:strand:+ start:6295 stop:7206 length:912 start_codon:yes stop_codon:yes gene_type:complete
MIKMKKCVILTMDDCSAYEVYDHLLIEPLNQAGWLCDTISWRANNINWNDYQLVMVRSPWDYQLDCDAFVKVLKEIDDSSAHLDNPLTIMKWNINKHYLRELATQGIEIVPTLWFDDITAQDIPRFFSGVTNFDNYINYNSQEIVIKPCISAGAFDTYRLTLEQAVEKQSELLTIFKQREFMVQPFVESIISEGEFSLFYFDDEFSHAILKTPQNNDYRVQEEFGSLIVKIDPELSLKQHAEKVLSVINSSLLYARLDFARTATGFALMEAELIEPSLYFNFDKDSPQRFVNAVERRMRRLEL